MRRGGYGRRKTQNRQYLCIFLLIDSKICFIHFPVEWKYTYTSFLLVDKTQALLVAVTTRDGLPGDLFCCCYLKSIYVIL